MIQRQVLTKERIGWEVRVAGVLFDISDHILT
jgi:hypothetical protein